MIEAVSMHSLFARVCHGSAEVMRSYFFVLALKTRATWIVG